jgi:hypothetical protein
VGLLQLKCIKRLWKEGGKGKRYVKHNISSRHVFLLQ